MDFSNLIEKTVKHPKQPKQPKKMTHREFYEIHLFGNQELLSKMEKGMEAKKVIAYLQSKVSEHDVTDPHGLMGDIDYEGSMAKRFRKQGYELVGNINGTRWYTTVNGQKVWTLKPGGPNTAAREQREAFPKKVVQLLKKKGTKCTLSGITIDGLPQIDHRTPILRTKTERKFDETISDVEIHQNFMGVCAAANMKKKEVCNRCSISGKRPGGTYKANVPFWFSGGEDYIDNGVPGAGCNGCYWNNPERWAAELTSLIRIVKVT